MAETLDERGNLAQPDPGADGAGDNALAVMAIAESDEPQPESQAEKLKRWADPRMPNLADEIDDQTVSTIGMRVVEEAGIDDGTRSDWLKVAEEAMELALQRPKAKTFPWPGASNVVFPLLTEACDQFAARAYPAIIQNRQIVKAAVVGDDEGYAEQDPRTGGPVVKMNPDGTPALDPEGKPQVNWLAAPGEKAKRAARIAEHMSYQILEEMPEWERETDVMLHVLPVVGCEFRKTYFNPVEGRDCSVRVPAADLILDYKARSLETAPRATEVLKLYPYEIEEHKRSGYFRDVDYGASDVMSQDPDAPHTFYEQHRRWDLDGDGYPEPYIVTVHKSSQTVARIVARYDYDGVKFLTDEETGQPKVVKIIPVQYYTQYDFMPNKDGGIYGWGFGHSLKHMNEAANAVLNQLIDAGTLQNTGGGFIGRGLSLHSGDLKFKPGEYKYVNAAGSTVRDSIVPFQHKGPSLVLFQLLGTLVEAGKSISSVKDVITGELKAQTMSPTVFMALVEQGLKVFTAIYKRYHRGLKSEFEKVIRLNRIYLEETASYKFGNDWKKITRKDYLAQGSGVEPVSDPTMVADVQRMARSEFLMQFKDDPMLNGLEIRRRALVAANIEDVETLLISKPAPNPEMIAKSAALELQAIEVRASALLKLAQSVKALAEADAKVQEPFHNWADAQINLMMKEVDAINGRKQSTLDAGLTADSAAAGEGA